ncbi:MAG: hypothetical protein K2P52_09665 [Campylobacterales bacterium]|nr:hypothetical protein [Campylobacterales bacterium]
MQENQYEKIKVLFLKLIVETKELNEVEFEKILIQVFKENPFSSEVKERLVIDIAKMREKILKNLDIEDN